MRRTIRIIRIITGITLASCIVDLFFISECLLSESDCQAYITRSECPSLQSVLRIAADAVDLNGERQGDLLVGGGRSIGSWVLCRC